MPRYIRDDEVDELAREVQAVTGAPRKSQAVKQALRRAKRAKPLSERLKPAIDLIASIGPSDPNFDMKAYTDEMWGGS